MSKVVIIDEQDASVTFAGQWDHLTDPVQYNQVSTGSSTAGTTCSFKFTGTSISVVTTIVRAGPFALQFTLDGVTSTNSSSGLTDFSGGKISYHDTTFFADNLDDVEHQVVITNTRASSAINIYLDYFLYTASPKTNLTNTNIFMDDRDTIIQYSGNWRLDTADSQFRHTARAADNTSRASLSIPFEGSGIQFFGLINSGRVGDMLLAEFILDSTLTTTYAPPEQSAPITYNNKIFDSGSIFAGSHTLVVTPKNEHLVWIDYVLIQQGLVSSAGATLTRTSVAPSQSFSAPASAPAPAPTNSVNVGAIAGGVVAGLLALIAGVLLFLFLRMRRRRAAATEGHDPSIHAFRQQSNSGVVSQPYAYASVPPRALSSTTGTVPPPFTASSPQPDPSSLGSTALLSPSSSDLSPPMGTSTEAILGSQRREYEKMTRNLASRSANNPASPPPAPLPIVHQDSGIRMNRVETDTQQMTELPPTYTED